LNRRSLLQLFSESACFLELPQQHLYPSTKKPFKHFRLEGLHPVCLALICLLPKLYPDAELWRSVKAGLLASPPFQQPSHSDQSKQWHNITKRVPFSFRTKKAGSQRRDHSRFSRDSLLSSYVHLNNMGGFTIKCAFYQEKNKRCRQIGFLVCGRWERGSKDYRRKLLNNELRWLNTEQSRIVRF